MLELEHACQLMPSNTLSYPLMYPGPTGTKLVAIGPPYSDLCLNNKEGKPVAMAMATKYMYTYRREDKT